MTKILKVQFQGETSYGEFRFFDTVSGLYIYVESYKDGNIVIGRVPGVSFKDTAVITRSFFNKESNMEEELQKLFGSSLKEGIHTVQFIFEEVTISATKDTTVPEMYQQLNRGLEEQRRKLKAEISKQKRYLEIVEKISHIGLSTELEFIDEQSRTKWEEIVEKKIGTLEGEAVVLYAEIWAKYMQHEINRGGKLEDVASITSQETNIYRNVSMQMFEEALAILMKVWIYAEELRFWNDSQYR